jgi:type II secretory pathway pseudopilin PulG
MTLIEVMVSMAILAVAFVTSLSCIVTLFIRDRQVAMEVVALQTINKMTDEIEMLSQTAPGGETAAHYIVRHIREKQGQRLPIGPDGADVQVVELDERTGTLLYRFEVASPGDEDNSLHYAMGEMAIYLSEPHLNNTILPRTSWSDLSNVPAGTTGMDLNLNDDLTDNLLRDYEGIQQLAMRIGVVIFSDRTHRMPIYQDERSILMTKLRDTTRGFDPTVPPYLQNH